GLLNFVGRKLDLVAEFEDRVPAYVEQMFDRLEASGIITGWDRDDWDISTTRVGLNIRIRPRRARMEQEVPGEGWSLKRNYPVFSCDVCDNGPADRATPGV